MRDVITRWSARIIMASVCSYVSTPWHVSMLSYTHYTHIELAICLLSYIYSNLPARPGTFIRHLVLILPKHSN